MLRAVLLELVLAVGVLFLLWRGGSFLKKIIWHQVENDSDDEPPGK